MAADRPRVFEIIPGRKYDKIAELLGGQRCAAFFVDRATDTWYAAESWKRPNLRVRLNAEQIAYVRSHLNG